MTEHHLQTKIEDGDPDDPKAAELREWIHQHTGQGAVSRTERVVNIVNDSVVDDVDGLPDCIVTREHIGISGSAKYKPNGRRWDRGELVQTDYDPEAAPDEH